MEYEGDSDTNCNRCTRNNRQRIGGGTGRFKYRRTNKDHLDYSIVKISQNSESNPEDLKRLAVTQNPVKNHLLMLVWKTRKEEEEEELIECSKIAQKKYKTRQDWEGKVIHWVLSKKFKFDHTNKRYMHNLASVVEDDAHKLLWDFDIQTDHLISARRPDLIINNKKENLQNCGFCCPGWPQNKTEKMWNEG